MKFDDECQQVKDKLSRENMFAAIFVNCVGIGGFFSCRYLEGMTVPESSVVGALLAVVVTAMLIYDRLGVIQHKAMVAFLTALEFKRMEAEEDED